jgi:uncharacterized protein
LDYCSNYRSSQACEEHSLKVCRSIADCAILLTRLQLLPRDKIEREIAYLAIAIEKTAGPREREAWSWLMQKHEAFYARN